MRPIRSFLFVPATRPTWVEKALASGADALILDLEDSVPAGDKASARAGVAERIVAASGGPGRFHVRINVSRDGPSCEDIAAICRQGLEGIVLPKVEGPEDVEAADRLIGDAERTVGLPGGSIALVATLESARGLQLAYECACHPRVAAIIGASAKDADVSRSVGFRWTPGGQETLFLRSRVVLAARAAGKLPIGGLWQQVHDLDGLRRSATQNRELGMTGELSIHPSNAPVLNEVYSPSAEEVAYYSGMIQEYERALVEGRGAVIYKGEHIDAAHIKTARDILGMARPGE